MSILLSASLAASLGSVELVIEAPSSMVMAPAVMLNGGGLSQLVAQLERQIAPPVKKAPMNPCAEDMHRFQCADSACLKMHAEDLNPTCAAFLLGDSEPEPSPALEELLIEGPGAFLERMRQQMPGMPMALARPTSPQPVAVSSSNSAGFYTIMTSDSDGHVYRSSGNLRGGDELMRTSALAPFFPPELLDQIFGGLILEQDVADDGMELEPPSTHPCARELAKCEHEKSAPCGDVLEAWLVEHFAELSSECRCAVHHLSGFRPTSANAAVMPAATAKVATATAEDIIIVEGPEEEMHPLHRVSCLFFFLASMVVSIMLARSCVLLCCGPSARATRRVVLVPPEAATIKAVNHHEAVVIQKQEKVQVAEPLSR